VERLWYYELHGERKGPVKTPDLEVLVGQGLIGSTTLVWTASMPSWQKAEDVTEIGQLFGTEPPPLPGDRRRSSEITQSGAFSEPATAVNVRTKKLEAEAFYRRPREELAQLAFEQKDWGGFWRRLAANWIDGLVLYVPTVLVYVAGYSLVAAGSSEEKVGAFASGLFLSSLLVVLYHALFLSSRKVSTPGRMAAGVAVICADTGHRIGFGKAILRSGLSLIGYLLIIPNLLMLFTRRKQTVADLLSKSVVVCYRPGNAVVIVVAVVLITIALAGILAAIAIPQYQDYTVRARLAEVRVDLIGYSRVVESYLVEKGQLPPSLDVLSYRPSSRWAKFAIVQGGGIRASVSDIPGSTSAVIGLDPNYDKVARQITWHCGASNIPERYLRADCRTHALADSGSASIQVAPPSAASQRAPRPQPPATWRWTNPITAKSVELPEQLQFDQRASSEGTYFFTDNGNRYSIVFGVEIAAGVSSHNYARALAQAHPDWRIASGPDSVRYLGLRDAVNMHGTVVIEKQSFTLAVMNWTAGEQHWRVLKLNAENQTERQRSEMEEAANSLASTAVVQR